MDGDLIGRCEPGPTFDLRRHVYVGCVGCNLAALALGRASMSRRRRRNGRNNVRRLQGRHAVGDADNDCTRRPAIRNDAERNCFALGHRFEAPSDPGAIRGPSLWRGRRAAQRPMAKKHPLAAWGPVHRYAQVELDVSMNALPGAFVELHNGAHDVGIFVKPVPILVTTGWVAPVRIGLEDTNVAIRVPAERLGRQADLAGVVMHVEALGATQRTLQGELPLRSFREVVDTLP
mmetsp:Transcript_77977/g.216624  ORF Transcript_77977/g.216624 Transcript_77977/m.216624 type:complete len:233 (-) Transcript_77977:253-951(-)